jgi:G3E family GTPase
VNLSPFFKGSLDEDPDAALQALMRAILIRTQFLPAVRHAIGWRGLKQSSAEAEGWTAKVRDCAGVFGLFFMGVEPTPGWTTGCFGLCYFPDPAEALVERCSLRAAAITQAEDYRHCIRDFLQHPEMCELFGVGSLLLSVRRDQRALALAMQSVSSQRTVAREGVCLPQGGQMVQLVAPGGYDQNLPAFEITLSFFDVLAASVTFNLEQPPRCLIERRYPATQRVYDRLGTVFSQDAPDLWKGLVVLGYGEGDFDTLCSAVMATKSVPISAARADDTEAAPREYRDKPWWRAHQLKGSKSVATKILGVDERPPLIILTGFLGSGKTSFLQHFIEYQTQRSRFVAVIQNEIGEVGLDGKLLDYTVTEIDEGCVCCSLAGNLKQAVRGFLESFSPDTIILETSGLANPLNLLEDITELGEVLRFDSTVTLVDALNLDAALADSPIAADQIRAADVIVLNKSDLVDDARLEAVRRRVQEINPRAPQFCTTQGDLNPGLIFDADDSGLDLNRKKSGAGFVPHPTHSEAGLWSKSQRLPNALDREKFIRAVGSLPPAVFRVKGILEFSDSPQPLLFQYVAGRFELSLFPQPAVTERFLTVIGRGGDVPEDFFSIIESLMARPVA